MTESSLPVEQRHDGRTSVVTLFRSCLPMQKQLRTLAALATVVFSSACSSVSGSFVWADAFNDPQRSGEKLIAEGDLISVRVREDEKFNVRERVQGGRVQIPLLDAVEVATQSTAQVARRVEDKLKAEKLFTSPHVTVAIEETHAAIISVTGLVSRSGTFPLLPGWGVLEALAAAGGLTDFAHKDRIFVLRKLPQPVRIRFTYQALTSGQGPSAAFQLKEGDVIVVE